MKNLRIIICFLLTSSVFICHAQKHPSQKLTNKIIPAPDTIYTGIAYFSYPPFEQIKIRSFINKKFSEIRPMLDSMKIDAINITVEIKAYSSQTNIPFNAFSYQKLKLSDGYEKASRDHISLKTQVFEKGIVQFSGYPFTSNTTVNAKDLAALRQNLNKCRYGSVIILTDCCIKNADGSIGIPINKTIYLL